MGTKYRRELDHVRAQKTNVGTRSRSALNGECAHKTHVSTSLAREHRRTGPAKPRADTKSRREQNGVCVHKSRWVRDLAAVELRIRQKTLVGTR
jgi:hypothetical protein